MDNQYYAHSLEGRPPSEWQPLEEHLKNVAKMALSFSIAFYKAGFIHAIDEKNKIGARLNGVNQIHCAS